MLSTDYKISVKDSYEKKNTVKIDEFIRAQLEIRIIICTGGGYGNQRASITIINRILESGFNGKFYFNCDKRGDVRKKFDILLAQSYLDLKNIEYEEFDIIDIVKFTPVNLSFCGADDGLFNNLLIIKKNVYDFFNIKFLIALVPTDFIHYGQSIIYCKDIKIPFDTSDFVLSNHQKKYTLDYVKTKIFDDYYKNIYVILNDTYYTQAIYGLNDWNTNFMKKLDLTYNTKEKWNYSQTRGIDINEELKRIIDSYLKIKFDKPVIIIILSKLNESNLSFLLKYDLLNIKEYKQFNISDIKEYNIIYFEYSIPLLLFDAILTYTNMPAITEGANSISVIQESTDRGYIHGGKLGHTKDISQPIDMETNTLYEETELALTKQYSGFYKQIDFNVDISNFISEYIKPNNDIKKFYKIWHERFMERPDGFYTLLNFLIKNLQINEYEYKKKYLKYKTKYIKLQNILNYKIY